jgi:predicted Zn-dependent peptidase
VYSFVNHYEGTGQVGIYLGTRGENLAEAFGIVGTELERLRDTTVSDAELTRAKENLKGRMLLALESTSARMNRLGSSLVTAVPLLSVDDAVARIDAVGADDVAALAADLFAPVCLSAAGIGADPDPFRAALEASGTPLVAEPA